MSDIGRSIAAVLFSVVGGVMNASWPLCCKPNSPRFLRIATVEGWQWENVWLPFTLWGAVLNGILCLAVVGPSTLWTVYREASSRDLGLVCMFSFLWGTGTACFSLGVQLLGAGPGTALVMSLLVVIGTLLPLIEDHADDAGSPAAMVTIVGLLLAISGFGLSSQSSRIKARVVEAARHEADTSDKRVETELASFDVEASSANKPAGVSKTEAVGGDTGGSTWSKMHKAGSANGLPVERNEGDSFAGGAEGKKTSHLAAVAVCVTGAVMSSMLQFSFVYGEPLIASAEDVEGVPGAAAPLVVWLIAFSLAAVNNVTYACVLLWRNGTWARYTWAGWEDFLFTFLKVSVMSVFFVGHIHFYGQSQHLFGELGPVVAWPLIMSSTVLGGQIWGVLMKEWVGVPPLALKVNVASICLLVTAVTVIAIAGAVL